MHQLVKGIDVGLMDGPILYIVAKGMRDNEEKKNEHLSKLATLLGTGPISLDVDFNAMKDAMIASEFELHTFGGIFYDTYPR